MTKRSLSYHIFDIFAVMSLAVWALIVSFGIALDTYLAFNTFMFLGLVAGGLVFGLGCLISHIIGK